jgi:hypothetical protein
VKLLAEYPLCGCAGCSILHTFPDAKISAQGLSCIIGFSCGLPWTALNLARKQLLFIVVNPHFNLFPYTTVGTFRQGLFQPRNL